MFSSYLGSCPGLSRIWFVSCLVRIVSDSCRVRVQVVSDSCLFVFGFSFSSYSFHDRKVIRI